MISTVLRNMVIVYGYSRSGIELWASMFWILNITTLTTGHSDQHFRFLHTWFVMFLLLC